MSCLTSPVVEVPSPVGVEVPSPVQVDEAPGLATSTPPKVLTTAEVGALLMCSKDAIFRRIRAGKMPSGFKKGGKRYWSEAEFHSWIAAGKHRVSQPVLLPCEPSAG